jgi:hypothetical protein
LDPIDYLLSAVTVKEPSQFTPVAIGQYPLDHQLPMLLWIYPLQIIFLKARGQAAGNA